MRKQTTNGVMILGAMLLSMAFAPGASAGCGKGLANKLTVLPAIVQADSPALLHTIGVPEDKNNNITGMWQTAVILSGQTIFEAFESFTSEGLEFLNDNGPTLEGNVCFGVWNSGPRNTYKVYHPAWNYDASGNLIGTVVIKSTITLAPNGKTFTGSVVVDTYGLDGSVSAPELQAQLTGKRITGN